MVQKALKETSFDYVFVTPVVKCLHDKAPTKKMVEWCESRLKEELEGIKPHVILCLGKGPATVFGMSGALDKVKNGAYNVSGLKDVNAKLILTYSADKVLDDNKLLTSFLSDFRKANRVAKELIEGKPNRVFNYGMFESPAEFEEWVDKVIENKDKFVLAADIETTGLDPRAADARVRTIAFSWAEGYGRCVPFELDPEGYKKVLKRFLESDVRFVFHNAVFDLSYLRVKEDIWVKNLVGDTMLMCYMLDSTRGVYGYPLKPLALEYTDLGAYDTEVKAGSWDTIDLDILATYCIADTDATLRLYKLFYKQIYEQQMTPAHELMTEAVHVICDLQINGVAIDVDYVNDCVPRLEEIVARYHTELVELAGRECDWNSPKELGKLMYDELGYQDPYGRGSQPTDDEALDRIGTDFTRAMQKYRKAFKMLSTYFKGYFSKVDADGRLRARFNLTGTACVAGDTLVATDKGIVPIASLCSPTPGFTECNTQIVNIDGAWESSTHTYTAPDRETKILTLAGGLRIEATDEHPLRAIPKALYCSQKKTNRQHSWVRAGDIRCGDRVVVKLGYNKWASEYYPIEPYQQTRNTNSKVFKIPTRVNESIGRLLGYYYADGSIHDANDSFGIRITNNRKWVQESIKDLCREEFNTEVYVSESDTRRTCTCISGINLKPLFIDILKIDRGCTNKVIPECILKSPRSVVIEFLKGLFLDSCVPYDPSKQGSFFKFTCGNKIIASQVQQLFFNLGIMSYVQKEKRLTFENNTWHTCVYGYELSKLFELGLIIKPESQNPIIKMTSRTMNRSMFDRSGGYVFLEVESIEEGRCTVYDLTVPGTHSFLANSIVSHNTGRLSSSEPNLQNLSRGISKNEPGYEDLKDFKVKNCIVAKPGHILLQADQSQLEMRLAAVVSQDPVLINEYKENIDIHSLNAMIAFGIKPPIEREPGENDTSFLRRQLNWIKENHDVQRTAAKSTGFGTLYGMSRYGLKFDLDAKTRAQGKAWSLDECQHMIDAFHNKYKKLSKWMRDMQRFAKAKGYTYNLMGRRRWLPNINHPEYSMRATELRAAINTPIQGLGSDIMILGIINMRKRLDPAKAALVATVHDSVVLEIREDYVDEAKVIIKECLENPLFRGKPLPFLNVPLVADMEVGYKYGALKKLK